jgi:shikimate kinase
VSGATAPAGASSRHVVLVGLMGVGKSTVGRRLAKELERPFADVDEQVELAAGRAIPAIFRHDGEEAFRRLEAEVLAGLVARPSPLVIAAGGGVVTRAENRAALAGRTVVVWLRGSAGFLARRTDPTHRPLLAGDAEATLARLLAEREPLYRAVADLEVDVEPFHLGDDKPKRALARHIAELIAGPAATGAPAPAGPAAGVPADGPADHPAERPVGPAGVPADGPATAQAEVSS